MKSLTRKYATPRATVHYVALLLDQKLPLDAARSPLRSLKPICSRHLHACFTANKVKAETDLQYEPWRSTFTASRVRQEKQSETENWFIWKASFTPPHNPHCDLNVILVTAVIESLKSTLLSHLILFPPFSLSFSLPPLWCLRRLESQICTQIQIKKYKGPFGATVTSVKVLTSSYISQNGSLRTTFTSAIWFLKKRWFVFTSAQKHKASSLESRTHHLMSYIQHTVLHVPLDFFYYTWSVFRMAVGKTTAFYLWSAHLEIIWRYAKIQSMEILHWIALMMVLMVMTPLSTHTLALNEINFKTLYEAMSSLFE